MKFDQRVQVPGATLPEGEYRFVRGTQIAGQLITYVLRTKDGMLVATCLTSETRILRDDAKAALSYSNTSPRALRVWFDPSHRWGFEFVYSHDEAKLIYAASAQPVPYSTVKEPREDRIGTYPISGFGWPPAAMAAPVAASGRNASRVEARGKGGIPLRSGKQ